MPSDKGRTAGANMAGVPMEFDANVLVNLAQYLDYDFISIGDISACGPEDLVYEYEDETYYIRGTKTRAGSGVSMSLTLRTAMAC